MRSREISCVGEFARRVRQRHVEEPGRLEESPEVVVRAEDEELLLVGVPVTADPGETAGAVVERVSQDADAGLGVRNDAAAEEGVAWKGHRRPPRGCLVRRSTFQVHLGCILEVDIKMDLTPAGIKSQMPWKWTGPGRSA